MLMELEDLKKKYDIKITGIIHCGAHLAEEAPVYRQLHVPIVYWVEGNPLVMNKLRKALYPYRGNQFLIQALLTDTDRGERQFNITNYDGMSSSIFEFGQLHLDSSPDTKFVQRMMLETRTLDSLAAEHEITGCNFLNLDLQGAELLVLKGAGQTLNGIDHIYTEVNADYVYKDCALVEELDEHLVHFRRMETSLTRARWGDAYYRRIGL